MSICDVAIGVENAKFGLTETKLGLIPATISPYVMARVGETMARRIFMSAKIFSSREAVQMGILAQVCSQEELNQAVEEEISHYLKVAPGAAAKAKNLTRKMGAPINKEIIHYTAEQLAECWESEETQEGINAFFAKQTPSWIKKDNHDL